MTSLLFHLSLSHIGIPYLTLPGCTVVTEPPAEPAAAAAVESEETAWEGSTYQQDHGEERSTQRYPLLAWRKQRHWQRHMARQHRRLNEHLEVLSGDGQLGQQDLELRKRVCSAVCVLLYERTVVGRWQKYWLVTRLARCVKCWMSQSLSH